MLGGGFARDLTRKAVAAAAAAGAALVAVIAFGATVFYALSIVVEPLAAAAITTLLFAIAAAVVVGTFMRKDTAAAEIEDEEPAGLGQRAFTLFRERPIMGAVAALAGGFIFLRNPALATMVAAAFTEKSHRRRRY